MKREHKRIFLIFWICVAVLITVKVCLVIKFLATVEAKWTLDFDNQTELENPEVKIKIDGLYVTVTPDNKRFWGPFGEVESFKTPKGTHVVVTYLTNSWTDLEFTLYPGDEPPLPEEMIVCINEGTSLWKRNTELEFDRDFIGVLPYGTVVKTVKVGAPYTVANSGEHITANNIKIIIPKDVRKKFHLPKKAWVFGGDLKAVSEVDE